MLLLLLLLLKLILLLLEVVIVLVVVIVVVSLLYLLSFQVYLTGAAILGVLLSTGACFGFGFACGFLFGAPHQALIFLLLGKVLIDLVILYSLYCMLLYPFQQLSSLIVAF